MGVIGVAGGLLGMIGGHQAERRQYRNQREMMHQQYTNQLGLNRQGHDLQMDMWNKTNYGAQVQHMIDAGLNPALMYGSAGQGGTTGSQTGGSAAMGNTQQMQSMDLSNALLGAQIGKIDAETKEILGQTPEKEAVINELQTRKALQESNISLNAVQEKQVSAMANKLEADTNLTKKIQEMDYGGTLGKNISQNILDILTGNAGISGWDYLKIAAGITTLTYARSAKLVGKGASKVKQGIKNAKDKLKKQLNKVKKPKGNTKDYTRGHRMDQQDYMDIINSRRNTNR